MKRRICRKLSHLTPAGLNEIMVPVLLPSRTAAHEACRVILTIGVVTVTDDDGKRATSATTPSQTPRTAAAEPACGDKIILRQPTVADGAAVWSLIRSTGVLDVNSAYCYLMLSKFFAETCVVAETNRQIVGFASTFRLPTQPEVLFVWQIAVAASHRGRGLAKSMLNDVLKRKAATGVRYIQATISPSNKPSQALFQSFARDHGISCTAFESEGFPDHVFPAGSGHETEWMFRIGPLPHKPSL